jgi:tRNA U34 5-carboxymethylaminomethyl modifying GTPase MnmE/TrmE
LTSVVTTLSAGQRERLVVTYADGHEEERPVAHLADYVTEAGNPGNARAVDVARVELDDELLRAGIELVDTPGIGSIHSHSSAVARDFLPGVDAALCVLDAGQPLSAAERDLVCDATHRTRRVVIVVNKIEHLDHGDRAVASQFVRTALVDLLGDAASEIHMVSARTGEGLPALCARLSELAGEERSSLVLGTAARLAREVACDAAEAARFEARAIQLPLDELGGRARRQA